MNSYQRALRDFQDYVQDVTRSRYRTFEDAIRRLGSTLVPGTPLGDVIATLPPVDFDSWYEEQLATVGSMVGSGTLTWPLPRKERLAMQVAMIRKIASGDLDPVDLAHDFLYVRNSFDSHVSEFVEQIFRPFVRDFLRYVHENATFSERLRSVIITESPLNDAEEEPKKEKPKEELLLFISHSAADAAIAKALVELCRKALRISARHIRCTSVDGYRLPVGADTNDRLRTEVYDAKVFLALLTPSSLKSQFALFEMGARWGVRLPFFPVMAAGLEAGALEAPLSGLNAVSGVSPDQIRQLLEETGAALSLELEPMGSYSDKIEELVRAAAASPGPP